MKAAADVGERAPKGARSRGRVSGQPMMHLGGLSGCNGPFIPGGEAQHRSRARPVVNGGQGGTDERGLHDSEGKRERKWAADMWGCHNVWVICVAGGKLG
jgi:hypothetical protein